MEMTLGLPTFVGNDVAALRDAARANLGFFTALPFFQRLMRASMARQNARWSGAPQKRTRRPR